tara:strand:+ start:2228 stop:2674 length:447 start_codon:yes stop_codon:yes gene_type:complete
MKRLLKLKKIYKLFKILLNSKKSSYVELKIIITAIKYQIYIKVFSFNKILRKLERIESNNSNFRDLKPPEINNKILLICEYLGINSCFVKSLTAFEILKFYQNKPQLIIGVKKEKEKFFSHSWIKIDNENLSSSESDLKKFNQILEVS